MKKIFVLFMMLAALDSTAFSQEQEQKTASGVSVWLKGLRQKISQIMPRKSIAMTTGVAGVRGAKEDVQVKLYWKGKKAEEPVTEEELQEFKEALDFVEKGDRAGAVHELEELLKRFPDSALVPDVKKTLDLVKAEPGEEKKEAVTDEKK